MSKQDIKSRRQFLMMTGAAMLGATGAAKAAEEAFGFKEMEGGYQQVASMEGKCGAGKCGANMKKQAPMEGKYGAGKCGANMKKKEMEGKCGSGKCGANMKKKEMEGKCGGNQ
ncbi:HvfA family oxazolone/thioamide-modified RiPP metallophore [Galenea microaerophila]